MPTNIRTIENAYLNGKARLEGWAAKYLEEFMRPTNETMLSMLWASMSEDEHKQVAQMTPDAYAEFAGLVTETQHNGGV